MIGLLLTIGFTAAVLIGARCFALYIARISEGQRPFHPTDDLLGDCPDVPRLTAPADYVECAHRLEK